MSSLSVHDILGINAFDNKIRIPSGHQLNVDGAFKLPVWTDSTRPASPEVGLVGYNEQSGRTEIYDGSDWVIISKVSGGSGTSANDAAESADAILQANPSATSGKYWININGTPKEIYCLMNPTNANGGWHLVMAIRRQDNLLLNTAAAVNTVPADNPFIVGNQAKLSDADITLLGPQSTGYYNILMEQYTWRSNPTSPPGYSTTTPWPLDGTTVCTYAPLQGLMPTGNISGDFQRSSFWFKSTVPLRGSGTKITGSVVTGMTTVNRYNPAGTTDAIAMTSVNNTPGQHQYDSTTYIYDLCVGASTGSTTCAYATTCGDGKSGPYGHETTYNCYHRYNLIYVR